MMSSSDVWSSFSIETTVGTAEPRRYPKTAPITGRLE